MNTYYNKYSYFLSKVVIKKNLISVFDYINDKTQ
jgi:hypothetical protein